MITRLSRTAAAMVALLLGLMAVAVPVSAQDTTPTVTSPVTVGQTEVAWPDDWTYEEQGSGDSNVSLSQVDADSGSLKLASYGELEDSTVESPQDAIDKFATQYFESAGATGATEAGSGELENGAAWKIYTFDISGLHLTLLVTVSETSDGVYVVSTLTGNTDQFPATIEQAQEEITLNGEPTFLDGVDAQQVTSGLNATPVASPEATPGA